MQAHHSFLRLRVLRCVRVPGAAQHMCTRTNRDPGCVCKQLHDNEACIICASSALCTAPTRPVLLQPPRTRCVRMSPTNVTCLFLNVEKVFSLSSCACINCVQLFCQVSTRLLPFASCPRYKKCAVNSLCQLASKFARREPLCPFHLSPE